MNGLPGISDSPALYVAGPALDGLISAVVGPLPATYDDSGDEVSVVHPVEDPEVLRAEWPW
ncbi:hypothetical protein Aca07nite_83480 [Actinoplanes capillaceus]|uniref:Uncharacterized protein n=1 Tax=Actinoplanes campanulatus TaxID=113559 RepID=A0ABQ3WXQ6_9ACTN|nr:hypothetical protein Aca07nite_83480 [Actinoplanes capillaceus]